MQVNDFNGITSFHEGQVVSDYCNMLPMEKSAIDRLGSKPLIYNCGNEIVRATFVDSKKNIYVATSTRVRRYQLDLNGAVQEMSFPNGEFVNQDANTEITFCESSTKPSQVYMCDGKYVYYWNTESLVSQADFNKVPAEYKDRVSSYHMTMLPIGNIELVNYDGIVAESESTTGLRYGWWPNVWDYEKGTFNTEGYSKLDFYNISAVTWFNNRLVLTQADKNTVWLSQVDPSRWLVPVSPIASVFAPFQLYQTGLNNEIIWNFIPNYYSSTASNAVLNQAVAFAGQLYFLNDNTIEVWSATGSDANPIQHNTLSTLYYGGRSPCIVADSMYLICHDQINNDFIARVATNGQVEHVSNHEIDKMISPTAWTLRPLSARDISMIVVYKSHSRDDIFCNGFVVTRDNKWWRYYNSDNVKDEFAVWTIGTIDGHILDVTNRGSICEQVLNSREHFDGRPIARSIRGFFVQTIARQILRSVEILCDTGVKFGTEERGQCFLRVSFDRGLSFGPYLYRKLGSAGTNDRTIIWRNCGSGNSILLEFGTSDNVRFQMYGISVEQK